MSKITGWEKVTNKSNLIRYRQTTQSKYGYPLNVEILKATPGYGYNWLLHYGPHTTTFKSKKETIAYAVKYMRSHPRG